MAAEEKYLIAIIGPTASGKTDLSIDIAEYFNTDILSCDSRQFYKEMMIGTARPTEKELSTVPHHFIGHISIQELYTAGRFEQEALELLGQLFRKKDSVVMVGGSGMYANAVFSGLDDIPSDLKIRKILNAQYKKKGLSPLLQELQTLDPEFYDVIDKDNPQRVIRALEVYKASGKTYSSFRCSKPKSRFFKIIKVGIEWDRTDLYERINQRVAHMMASGLLDEVKYLLPYKNLNALNTVGYKELFDHLNGNISLEEAIEAIKKNTRRFAKRQMTWFKRDKDIHWFKPSEKEKVVAYIEKQMI